MRIPPLLCLLAIPAASATPDALVSKIRPLNRELLSLAAQPKAAARAARDTDAAALIAERASALSRLIEIDPRRALSLALPEDALRKLAAAIPQSAAGLEEWGSWSGAITELIADNMRTGTSRRLLWMRTPERTLQLYFVREPGRLASGDLAVAQGVRLGARVAVAVSRRLAASSITPSATAPNCTLTGEQPVAALLVNFPGVSTPELTPDDVRQTLFGDPGPSLDGYWRDASYGKTSAKGDVFGWFALSRAYGCDELDELMADALQAARKTVDLTPYTRIFVYYPEPESGCDYSAMGTLGCNATKASYVWMPVAGWWDSEIRVQLAIHEAGHSLGLDHSDSRDYGQRPLGAPGTAGARTEYDDPFSAMGNYPYFGHYTAQQKLGLGWLSFDQVTTVEGAGDFTITPLGTPGGQKVLKIHRSLNPSAWLWLEYRQPTGDYESTLPEQAFSSALIHYSDSFNGVGPNAGHTDLLDFTPQSTGLDFLDTALAAGRSWVDPWTPRGIEITAAAPDALSVRVTNDACVTLFPLSKDHGPGAESGSINVTAAADCQWTAVPSASWITVTSGASGSGNGVVSYSVEANPEGTPRTGELAIGRKPVLLSQAAENKPPVVSYFWPATGNGPVLDLWALFDDPNGLDDLKVLRVNVNATSDLSGGCALEFDLDADTARIINDDGTAWLPPVSSLMLSTLSNSRCRVIDGWAYWGMVSLTLAFSDSELGLKNIYTWAQDAAGVDSGWQQEGSWTVTLDHPPAAVAASPASGVGYAQAFTFVYSDPDGAYDLSEVTANFSGTPGACSVSVWPYSELLVLGSASGYLGDGQTLENDYCAVDLAHSWVRLSGNDVRANLAMTFKPAFDGLKDCVLQATDLSGASSPVLLAGEWTVGALDGPKPVINDGGTVNAASFAGGPVAPGEVVTIFGSGLGPQELALARYDSAGYLANVVGDTKVFFDGVQAPIVYSQDGYVSAIVPYAVSGTTKMKVDYQGRDSEEVELPVAFAAPGIYKYPVSSQGVVVNAEETDPNRIFNSAEAPAARGKIVTLFATGEGPTTPDGVDGWLPVTGGWPEPAGEVVVRFGDVQGEILWKGLTYAGVLQINVRVPMDAPQGPAVRISLSVAGISDAKDTTIALE